MAENFGIESHRAHISGAHREASRFLIVIDAEGESLARLFTADRVQVAEFDASTEEVAVMTRGLVAQQGACGIEWNVALSGHSRTERLAAELYTLDV